MTAKSSGGAGKAKSACPICGKPATVDARPFCSSRCRTIDLGRWLDGSYAVPAVEIDDVDDVEDAESNDVNRPPDR